MQDPMSLLAPLSCLQFLNARPEPLAIRFLNPILRDLIGR
jgi:hypothetical protein